MPDITKTGHILKELPEGIEKASDGSHWAIASVEKIDDDGDIVRISGMDLSSHRPESPIKILAQHLRRLPDGSAPVIGKVEELRQAVIKDKSAGNVKAQLFRFSYAPSKLAQSYKELADEGYLDSFSIGAAVIESKPIKGGGTDFIKTKLREISMVTIPANADAVMLRALEDKLGDDLELKSNEPLFDNRYTVVINLIAKLFDKLDEQNKSFQKRFDNFESAYVAKADEGSQPGDRQEPAQEVDWDAIVSSLKSLSKKR